MRSSGRRLLLLPILGLSFFTFLFFSSVNGTPIHHPDEPSTCNYITLVKCFINVLDEWAWTLYELRDNVVTINSEQCEHLRQLDRCINDDGLEEEHQCKHHEIISASNTVSDLLTHRKNSGSFLKSYYLLTYACSAEGQQLLNTHRTCLSREKIGEMTLSAGTYLSERFLQHSDEDVCEDVNAKLQEYMDAMSDLCEEEASIIMCKSLTNMFKGLHADRLHSCEFTCLKQQKTPRLPPSDEYEEEEEGQAGSRQQGEADSLSGTSGVAPGAQQSSAILATAASLALFFGTAMMLRH